MTTGKKHIPLLHSSNHFDHRSELCGAKINVDIQRQYRLEKDGQFVFVRNDTTTYIGGSGICGGDSGGALFNWLNLLAL